MEINYRSHRSTALMTLALIATFGVGVCVAVKQKNIDSIIQTAPLKSNPVSHIDDLVEQDTRVTLATPVLKLSQKAIDLGLTERSYNVEFKGGRGTLEFVDGTTYKLKTEAKELPGTVDVYHKAFQPYWKKGREFSVGAWFLKRDNGTYTLMDWVRGTKTDGKLEERNRRFERFLGENGTTIDIYDATNGKFISTQYISNNPEMEGELYIIGGNDGDLFELDGQEPTRKEIPSKDQQPSEHK